MCAASAAAERERTWLSPPRKKTNRASGKRSTAQRTPAPAPREQGPGARIAGGIVCLLLALCVAVSYFNAEAVFLKLLRTALTGLCGYGYWLWAVMLLAAGLFLLLHRERRAAGRVLCALLTPPAGGQPAASAAGKARGGCVPVCPVDGRAGPYRRRRAVRRPGRAGQDVHKRDRVRHLGRHRPAGVHFRYAAHHPGPGGGKRPASEPPCGLRRLKASRRARRRAPPPSPPKSPPPAAQPADRHPPGW